MSEMNFNGSSKQLQRTRNGRIIAGVCSGVGQYIGVDPNILRLALGVASFFGGLGIGVYAVAWLLLPEEGRDASIVQDLIDKNKDGHVWQDVKSKWDQAQSNWSQQSQNRPSGEAPQSPYPPHAPGQSYEQHPYGRPGAATTQAPQAPSAPATPPDATIPDAPQGPPAPRPEDGPQG
ncbi:PspC domain-containing protein [Microbispora sp. RL4-1S]|uniref:PspC domain-containing protein n=1 Tax=Microbispora oryzae TaxID=2806554 RepID=A0A941AKS5_9ACTN|nr:PspC domain-containing protein [Microbispora oryzae]MBP2707770.1 PspC domain-containing protein [Microbispora oryzae]